MAQGVTRRGARRQLAHPARLSPAEVAERDALPETQPHLSAVRPPNARYTSSREAWVSRARRHAPFALVFALAIFLLTLNVATPWHSSHEDNGLVFESAAINHIRFGLGFTKAQDYFDATVNPPIITPGSIHPRGVSDAREFQYLLTGPAQPDLYDHHPPLLGLTVAASLLAFGYHFWAVRLVPIVFTLLALALFYLLMMFLFQNRRLAVFAALLFITFPIAAYYGRDVSHEAPTMCCELGMALCYTLWRRRRAALPSHAPRDDRWLLGVAGCVAIGMAYGWPMFFFAWILPALDTLQARRIDWRLALATGGTVTLMFSLLVVQMAWVDGWSLNALRDAFLLRSASDGANSQSSQLRMWVLQILHHNILDFGPWTWLALPAGLVFLWRRYRHEGLTLPIQLIALFGLGGLTHIVVFREGAYVHDYWQFYLIPCYAALLGWGGYELARLLSRQLGAARMRWAPGAGEVRVLLAFSVLALVMGAPLIYHLYAGGSLLHFPGTEPVTPLLGALMRG
ncbi:MAG TPA: glycosyltransferase family 39 protein [Ktedonobacterales bacterium]|nr:glycosyltransferase family 39 protein [Ktedonobacterales bacterium]